MILPLFLTGIANIGYAEQIRATLELSQCSSQPSSSRYSEVLSTADDVVTLSSGEKVVSAGVTDFLERSGNHLDLVVHLKGNAAEVLIPVMRTRFDVQGSGRYHSVDGGFYIYNGNLVEEFAFPIDVDEKYIMIWNLDGAKFGDTLLLLNLDNEEIKVIGDYAWNSVRYTTRGLSVPDGLDYEKVSDHQMDIGENNPNLKVTSSKDALFVITPQTVDEPYYILDPGNLASLECAVPDTQ